MNYRFSKFIIAMIASGIALLPSEGAKAVAATGQDNHVVQLQNTGFDGNSMSGWHYNRFRAGYGFAYYEGSYHAYLYQTVNDAAKGLYKISAHAFEAYNIYAQGSNYKELPTASYMFVSEDTVRHPVMNIHDDAIKSNEIYYNADRDRYDCEKTGDYSYIPNSEESAVAAFGNNLYENTFYVYIDKASFNVGLVMPGSTEQSRWVCFDDMSVEFIGTDGIAGMVSDMKELVNMPMEQGCRARLAELIDRLDAAGDYDSMALIVAELSDSYVAAKRSAHNYSLLAAAVATLQERIDKGGDLPERALAESLNLLAEAQERMTACNLADNEAKDFAYRLETSCGRLNYSYLSVSVGAPGMLGNAILEKVENLSDVQSLKISGVINEDDIYNIQNRLTGLREIDMSDVDMTTLADEFFYKNQQLEYVGLPKNLEIIGEYAFYECKSLKSITIPSTLTTIGQYAFSYCKDLRDVTLNEGLDTMGYRAFYESGLTGVVLPSTLKNISDDVFSYNYFLKELIISEGVTNIPEDAFYDCNLHRVAFPSTLHTIAAYAFARNRNLSSIEFRDGLCEIGSSAFGECHALADVTLPSTLRSLGYKAFEKCENLKKVTCLSFVPPYVDEDNAYIFSYNEDMTGRELYVPEMVLSNYKQTQAWDAFPAILPIDYLSPYITVSREFNLALSGDIPADYKPCVALLRKEDGRSSEYGVLSVNGSGTLSMSSFSMEWDPYYRYYYNDDERNYCTLVNNSVLRSDEVSVTMWTPDNRWSFISFPFDVKVSDIETLCEGYTNYVIRRYDGEKRAAGENDATWVKMGSDDVLRAGEGYIIQNSRFVNDRNQGYSGFRVSAMNNANKNNIFINADAVVALNEYQSEFAHNRSWNLIGNPYPCYYDTRFMDFTAPITVWDVDDKTYTAYSPVDDSYILCPGEAFFVQCAVGNRNIVFGKDGRQDNLTARELESAAKSKAAVQPARRTVANVTITDGTSSDRTRIVLNENASMQYEMDRDAGKFMSTDESVPQIYSTSAGTDYAINERPLGDGLVELCTRISADGTYKITVNGLSGEYELFLLDRKTQETVDLNASGNEYSFRAKAGEDSGRFALIFRPGTTGIDQLGAEEPADGATYNLNGIRVLEPLENGVYIRNGKKIIVK